MYIWESISYQLTIDKIQQIADALQKKSLARYAGRRSAIQQEDNTLADRTLKWVFNALLALSNDPAGHIPTETDVVYSWI